jgi:hypothetical protein
MVRYPTLVNIKNFDESTTFAQRACFPVSVGFGPHVTIILFALGSTFGLFNRGPVTTTIASRLRKKNFSISTVLQKR